MTRKSRFILILAILLLAGLLAVWVVPEYLTTRHMVADATEILFVLLRDNPHLTEIEADSVLREYAASGSLNIRLIDDSIPGDAFGNPLQIDLVYDSTCIMVSVVSPGLDGFPGTFDDIACSRVLVVLSEVRFRSDFDTPDSLLQEE